MGVGRGLVFNDEIPALAIIPLFYILQSGGSYVIIVVDLLFGLLFRGSSAVEQETVNLLVVGSIPTLGAIIKITL